MIWRERIVAARDRGYFTQEDILAAEMGTTCAVGEAAQRLGKSYHQTADEFDFVVPGFDVKKVFGGGAFPRYVRENNFDSAERLLDLIEDRALELMRARV